MRNLNVPMYDPEMVRPMREELTRLGFEELRTPDEVDAVLTREQAPTLVVVNSVCGCAALNARPAAALAIQHDRRAARPACSPSAKPAFSPSSRPALLRRASSSKSAASRGNRPSGWRRWRCGTGSAR